MKQFPLHVVKVYSSFLKQSMLLQTQFSHRKLTSPCLRRCSASLITFRSLSLRILKHDMGLFKFRLRAVNGNFSQTSKLSIL
jgi:hypothetical protein